MPLYEYECTPCLVVYETMHGINDPAPDRCPKCGGSLHRLPNALRNGVSRQHPGTGRAFRAAERHTQDLCQDGRKRQQTPSRLLRQLRHADLCLCGGQSAELWLAYRDNHTTRGLLTEATRLAAFCAALGGCARCRARDRERVDRLNRDYFTQAKLRLTPYPQPHIVPPI